MEFAHAASTASNTSRVPGHTDCWAGGLVEEGAAALVAAVGMEAGFSNGMDHGAMFPRTGDSFCVCGLPRRRHKGAA